jgi:PII-like signaling protein
MRAATRAACVFEGAAGWRFDDGVARARDVEVSVVVSVVMVVVDEREKRRRWWWWSRWW